MAPPALLHNFRATALPKSPTFINVYGILSLPYAFWALWSLLLAHISKFLRDNLHGKRKPKEGTTTTTTTLFGQTVTLDISPSEFPSQQEIDAMEDEMPKCCRHGWLRSVVGGHQLHYRYFLPEQTTRRGQPKAIIIWMHGLQGFGGEAHTLLGDNSRKTNMALQAETYLKEGYALYAVDMLGHGYSEGARWYMPNPHVMLQDYLQFIQLVVAKHDEGTPLFLSGYSYGGCLTLRAARYLQDHPKEAPRGFQGVVLQAPAIYDLEALFLFPMIAWVTQHLINPVLGTNFRPPVWVPNRVHPRRFWRDPERYRVGMTNNGMNSAGRHIPMQTCLTLIQDMVTLRNQTIPQLQAPFCVVHGKRDVVVPAAGTTYLERASLTPRDEQAVRWFPNAYHDVLGEPEAQDAMEFQVRWIKQRIAAQTREEESEVMHAQREKANIHELIWTDSLVKVLQKVA